MVQISTFVVEGATSIPTDEWVATFEQYRGEQMYGGELQNVAQKLVGVYLERGWFVRVVLPERDISDGAFAYKPDAHGVQEMAAHPAALHARVRCANLMH